MSSVLKGNFDTKKTVKTKEKEQNVSGSIEERFEKEALKRLGGSIAFVDKKKVSWDLDLSSDE